jgi:hypothetical protein
VRWIFLLLCLAGFSRPLRAQQQESKLVDRLLRPDMSLANSAQDKKFTAVGGTSVDKKFEAKSFATGDEKAQKTFADSKNFFARVFGTKTFSRADATANAKANADIAYAKIQFATNESSLVRTSSDSSRAAPVHEYADQHPFRGQGTRQKIFSQQQENKPLTIDEVRELLNKSK